jgi:hypothetical protein
MRTLFTALGLTLVLHLVGCSGMGVAAQGACAIENSVACQMERTARVPS